MFFFIVIGHVSITFLLNVFFNWYMFFLSILIGIVFFTAFCWDGFLFAKFFIYIYFLQNFTGSVFFIALTFFFHKQLYAVWQYFFIAVKNSYIICFKTATAIKSLLCLDNIHITPIDWLLASMLRQILSENSRYTKNCSYYLRIA